MNWTIEQKSAIDLCGNIIVSAAAGSGKTAVLTERIARCVEEGTPITEMLVVTFTKAAAAEMKERIEKRLYAIADDARDTDKKSWLYSQAQSVGRANISTLHSFCMYILKRHFYQCGLSPAFRTADDTEAAIIKQNALEETIENTFARCEESGGENILLDLYGSEDKLFTAVDELHDFISVLPNGKEWLREKVEEFNQTRDEFAQNVHVKRIVALAQQKLSTAEKLYMEAANADSNEKAIRRMTENAVILHEVAKVDDYDALRAMINGLSLQGFSNSGKVSELAKANNDAAKEKIKEAKELLSLSLDEEHEIQSKLYPLMSKICDCVSEYYDTFLAKKSELSIIDFNDMERLTYELLQDKEIAQIYREKFAYIFVDEYQDINMLQNGIISSVSKGDNLFLVGDVKQSIYRFRNAEPKLFINRVDQYDSTDDGTRIDLNANFRSSQAVIGFVNTVFSQIMNKRTCETDYDEKSSLKASEKAPQGNVELHTITNEAIPVSEDSEGDTDIEDNVSAEAQATLVAERIYDLMNSEGFFDAKENVFRKYRYSDFVILLRSLAAADTFARVLSMRGIRVYAQLKGGYFDALEVQVFRNLLKVIDNRRRDIPLISVMHSAIGGFTAAELAQIRYDAEHDENNLKQTREYYDCVYYTSQTDTELGKKTKEFLSKVDRWYDLSKLLPLEELMLTLYDDTGYYRYVNTLPGGRRRVENLIALTAMAAGFESGVGIGLHDFLHYLDGAESKGEKSEAQTMETDAVNILSMHKSKGLEYNVVILPCLEKKMIAVAPSGSEMVASYELGIGTKYKDGASDVVKPLCFRSICENSEQEIYADELRLLYVAMTRAREKLILVSAMKDPLKVYNKIILHASEDGSDCSDYKKYIELIAYAMCACGLSDMLCDDSFSQELNLTTYLYSNRGAAMRDSTSAITREDVCELMEDVSDIDTSETNARITYEYPYLSVTQLPSKCSVTQFSIHDDKYTVRSEFIGDEKKLHPVSNALERGIATHTVLEKLSLREHDAESILSEVDALVASGYMTEEQKSLVDMEKIERFTSEDLWQRMVKSEKVEREHEFAFLISVKRLHEILSEEAFLMQFPNFDVNSEQSQERVLVQGVIDCCFIENGKWVIVDYKTDSVSENATQDELRTHSMRHLGQLQLYKEALLHIDGSQTSEAYIYYLRAGSVRMI